MDEQQPPDDTPEPDEKVGYKCPPKSGRFNKGNQMQRRKKEPAAFDPDQVVHEILMRLVDVKLDGKKNRMPYIRAQIERECASWNKNSKKAIEDLIKLHKETAPPNASASGYAPDYAAIFRQRIEQMAARQREEREYRRQEEEKAGEESQDKPD